MTNQDILNEVNDKFGEYIEMAGENSSAFVIDLLCSMVVKERDYNNYYKKVLKNVSINTAK